MPKIVPKRRAALGRIPPHIERAAVIRFHSGVMNLVKFDNVIVAREADSLMRTVVEKIVREPHADSTKVDMVSVGPLAARDVMNGVIDRLVPTWCESFSISAADLKTGRAGVDRRGPRAAAWG